ncbi:hypothetical protein GO730_39040 [Spirosoma sp. HMF3257]|uniref:Potassium channel domain-containing protein n=1 Tax=Spirosoma telluris TaxID=2183553 RepID=A0A327NG00_9BACT|nr:hypothetical protein [Spirosoma telluris]RAI72886.1 hypothetical protein HMF3257_38955 [Spirosoma telluris]
MKVGKQFELPKNRKQSFIERIDALSVWNLIGLMLILYAAPVFFFGTIEFIFNMPISISCLSCSKIGYWDLIYFNFVSILTIGYGDMSPLGISRVITIVEAVLGLAIYSLSISLITIKLLLPRKDIITFSRYAYYCLDDNSFMIIYLNTASTYITNLETSWYFKLNENWHAKTPFRVPFITKSVQTFYLKYEKSFETIISTLHPYDCLRVGLSGNIGMANYSTYVEYGIEDILIINNRLALTQYEGFYKVDENLRTEEFAEFFHYYPSNARKLSNFLNKPDE